MNKYDADLQSFRQNPDQALANLYRQHRSRFVQWAKGWSGLQEEDLGEIFQDSVIVFWNKIREDKLTQLTASVETFLFAIGRRLILSHFRKNKRTTLPGDEAFPLPEDWVESVDEQMIKQEQTEALSKILESVGEPCYSLLHYSFYEGKRSAEIAEAMNYASEEVVRTQKKRCLDRLRAMVKNKG